MNKIRILLVVFFIGVLSVVFPDSVFAALCCGGGETQCDIGIYERVCKSSPPSGYSLVAGDPDCPTSYHHCYYGIKPTPKPTATPTPKLCCGGGKTQCDIGIYERVCKSSPPSGYSLVAGDPDCPTSYHHCYYGIKPTPTPKLSDGSYCTENLQCTSGECNTKVNKCQNGCAGSSGLAYNCWCTPSSINDGCGSGLGCSVFSSDHRCKKTACGSCTDGSNCMNGACNPITGVCDTNWTCDGGNTSCTLNASSTNACTSSTSNRYACSCYSDGDCNVGLYCDHTVGCAGKGLCYKVKSCDEVGGVCKLLAECASLGGTTDQKRDCSFANGICCKRPVSSWDECSTDGECNVKYGDPCLYCKTQSTPLGDRRTCESKTSSSHPAEVFNGASGVCSGFNGDSVCSFSSITSMCSSSEKAVIDDSTGSDGDFNWHCVGSSGGTCGGTDGLTKYCSATNLPTKNGVCGTSDGTTVISQPTTNLCTSGTANWSITGTDSEGTDGTFDWKCTGTCGGTTDTCTAINDIAPTLGSAVLQTSAGSTVAVESGNRNHICQLAFGGNSTVRWVITGSDVQGVSDISTMTLRFRTDAGLEIKTSAIAAVNGVATFVVDTIGMTPGTYNVEVQIDDVHTPPGNRGWIDTGRDFKVWDCLVGVNGTVYDGSANAGSISCSGNVGYTDTIPAASVFTLGYFLGTESPRMMTVSSPTFVDGGNKLYWNSPVNYQSIFQDLPGSDPTQMRVNDSTCVSGISLDTKLADPYAASPSLKVEYSSVLDQDSWFSVVDGSVISAGKITNYVPVTCTTNCKTSVNGIVLQKDPSSALSGYDVTDNKYVNMPITIGNYSYDILKPKYFSTLGIGTTVSGSKKWSEISSLTGVIFISGNLEIDENITGNDFKMIIASGSITVDENVTQVKSTLIASSITVGGESSNQLVITGSLYSSGIVVLSRSFTDKANNNETPAVKVVYNPEITFKMPKELARSITQWKLN